MRSPLRHFAMVVHGARADRADFRHVVQWVRSRGHVVDVQLTFAPGDAAAFASDAARRGVDAVVACGGDGTVNEVVNGLDGFDTPLGVLPLGTANDFAMQAGIPADADHAMDVILRRKPTQVDTASLNGRRFLNVSTGGLGAAATAETPADAKQQLGAVAYAITGVRKLAEFEPYTARIRAPDFAYDGQFLMFAVGINRATGGGAVVTPRASATDGLLDLCVVEATTRGDFARIVLKIKRGEHVGMPGVHYTQVAEARIESPHPVTVNVDGETSDARVLHYRARPRDLWVHVAHVPGEADEDARH